MNRNTMIGLGAAAILVVFVGGNFISAANEGAKQEAYLDATMNDNRQVLGQYTTRISEMAQIPEMQRDDLAVVMERALNARYGEGGSKAVFQFINENYPGQLDNQLYRNIQTEMSSGRVAFASNQTKLLDQKRIYVTKLNQPISGFWLKLAGYPKLDLDKITVVSSTHANAAFESGVDDGVTLRGKSN